MKTNDLAHPAYFKVRANIFSLQKDDIVKAVKVKSSQITNGLYFIRQGDSFIVCRRDEIANTRDLKQDIYRAEEIVNRHIR